mmetsp:Transcript_16604/g.27391  ORF Transcript_16604/g.27391 Transcript_16604/m.27391 type:complete len:289 (+) Transcript_16604:3-869(+)
MGGGTSYSAVAEMDYMDNEDLEKYISPYTFGGAPKDGVLRKEDDDALEVQEDALCEGLFLFPHHQSHCGHRVLRRTCMLFEQNASEEEPAAALASSSGLKLLVTDASPNRSQAEPACLAARRCSDMRESGKRRTAMEEAVKRGQWAKPGQGPPKETRALSSGRSIAVGQGKNGEWAYVNCTTPDPGYEVTSIFIITAALVMVNEMDALKPAERGGVLTPAFAMHGSSWLEQVQAASFALSDGKKTVFEVNDGKPDPSVIWEALKEIGTAMAKLGEGFASGKLQLFADP